MFTLPVTVAWEKLDSSMISRLFVRHPHVGLQAAQLARRVLVFHRGAGVLQKTSFFLEEKLDFLLDYAFTEPLRRLWGCLCLCLGLQRTTAAAPWRRPSAARPRRRLLRPRRRRAAEDDAHQPPAADAGAVLAAAAALPAAHRRSRRSARWSCCTTRWATQARRTPPRRRAAGCASSRSATFRSPTSRSSSRDCGSSGSSADGIKIGFILLAGVATALYSFYVSRGDSLTVTATLITLLLWRMIMTWYYIISAKWGMDKFIQTTLYHRSQDSKKGVLLYVVNSIETHELRECLLLYALLLHHAAHPAEKAPAAAAARPPTGRRRTRRTRPPPPPPPPPSSRRPPPPRPPPAPTTRRRRHERRRRRAAVLRLPRRRVWRVGARQRRGSPRTPRRPRPRRRRRRRPLRARRDAAGASRPPRRVERPARTPAGRAGAAVHEAGGLPPAAKRRRARGLTSPTTPTSRSRSESGVYSSEAVFGVYSSPV